MITSEIDKTTYTEVVCLVKNYVTTPKKKFYLEIKPLLKFRVGFCKHE